MSISNAGLTIFIPIMLAACGTQTQMMTFTPPPPLLVGLDPAMSLPAGKESIAFEVTDTARPEVFNAYLRNDDKAHSPTLYARFKQLVQTFCGPKPALLLQDVVIILADERTPSPYMQLDFRCGEAA